MTIRSVISGSTRVLYFGLAGGIKKQMTWMTIMAHRLFVSHWSIEGELTNEPEALQKTTGMVLSLKVKDDGQSNAMAHRIFLPPALHSAFFWLLCCFNPSWERQKSLALCEVSCIIRVSVLENLESLWLFMKDKKPLFRAHLCPKSCCG